MTRLITSLLGFQREDITKIHAFNDRALVAWDMGTGKTICFLATALEANVWPALVVCPAAVKLQWQRQAWEHCRLKSTILSGEKPYSLTGCEKLVIINYEILGPWLLRLKALNPKIIGLDEVQKIGNIQSKTSRLCKILCKGVPKLIGMSGTPLTNKPWELYPIVSMLWPDVEELASPFYFGTTFCDAEKSFGKWKFSGARNLKQLHRLLLDSGMLRRTKLEVMAELPPIIRTVLPLEIEDRAEYEEAERDIIKWLAKTDLQRAQSAARAERYTRFSYLKQLAAKLKIKAVFACVDDWLASTDSKILLGCLHRIQTPILPMLKERYDTISTQIHGGMTMKQRQESEDRFRQDSRCRLLIGQIQAVTGLNLPEASIVGVVEIPWTPGACQQFIHRAHRLNSKHTVNAYFLAATNTIEERVYEIVQRKQKIMDQVMDGVDCQETSLTIFDELQQAMEETNGK